MVSSAPSYGKTENLLVRDEETHRLIPGQYRVRAFEQVGSWLVTEKIDGTNIRLIYRQSFNKDFEFDVRGRSDEATLPKNFRDEALAPDIAALMRDALEYIDPKGQAYGMVVFGEGYGPGIQKGGGRLAGQKSLRIFDILTLAEGREPLWRPFSDVQAVATILGLNTVPVISTEMGTEDVYDFVCNGPESIVAIEDGPDPLDPPFMEGVVARTDPYLYDSYGSRVLFKLKGHDLP